MDVTAPAAPATRLPAAAQQVNVDCGDGANSLDAAMLARIGGALASAEADPRCRVLVIRSGAGVFCTGMDLSAAGHAAASGAATGGTPAGGDGAAGADFFDLLHRMSRVPVAVVALVDGEAAGGGVGLVAASDLVYATERARFLLPEALWGLLPCCVLPFLERRVGFQRAYAMALSTQPVDAADAAGWGLVDRVDADPERAVRQLALRMSKVDKELIGDLKRYAAQRHPIPERTRELAIGELDRLMAQPRVRERLAAFAAQRRYPWEG